MAKPTLKPLAGGEFSIVPPAAYLGTEWDLEKILHNSIQTEKNGDIQKACNSRFEAVQRIVELIPDDVEMTISWEDQYSRNAMLLINCSAIDHLLVGDFEMSASMLELLLELDPEDHLEASTRLAYCYVALEEYELFDEVINDISDKHADKEILKMWSEFRQNGAIPDGELRHFKKSFPYHYNEFVADEHPVDEQYMEQINSEKPSKEALAREMWLQTESLWSTFSDFITTLKNT